MKALTRRRWLLPALLLMIILGGAAAYAGYQYYIGDPDDTPPTAPTLEAATQAQLVYRIDPAQSEVRYNTSEVFLQDNTVGNPIGRTKGVAGDILIDPVNPAQSQVGTIVINIEQFESDRAMRDGTIRRQFLQSSTYPEATFVTREILNFPDNPLEGEPFSFQIVGDLTVKETTSEETWDVTVTINRDRLEGSATTEILMSTYDVGPIELAGMLRTDDAVRLEFDFVALLVEGELPPPTTPEG